MGDMSNFLRLSEGPCRCCVELHCATVMGRGRGANKVHYGRRASGV